jgi:hypothetical protein
MIEVSDERRGLAFCWSCEYQGELLGEEEFLTHRRGGFDLFEIPRFVGFAAGRQVDSGAFGLDFYAENVRARIDAGNTHFLQTSGIDSRDEQLFSGTPKLDHDHSPFAAHAVIDMRQKLLR